MDSMSQVRSGSQAMPAALVGSLASFSLVDVLDLLTRAACSGELQVVGNEIDKRIWVDRGDLIDTTGSDPHGATLFELACVLDGWFYFTSFDVVPEGAGRIPLSSVIQDLGPQVTEWRSLVTELPFDATVRMSSTTPAEEVQIRSDQWQLLSLVGAGRSVREVIDASVLHPLDALRTLRELTAASLVAVDGWDDGVAGAGEEGAAAGVAGAAGGNGGDHDGEGGVAEGGAPAGGAAGGGATQMPGGDPATPVGETRAKPSPEPRMTRDPDFPARLPLPPFSTPPPPPPPPVPPPPSGAPEGHDSVAPPPGASGGHGDEPEAQVQISVMPPPISGDPWTAPSPPDASSNGTAS